MKLDYWRSAEAEVIKTLIIENGWGNQIPDRLWYDMGNRQKLTKEEIAEVVEQCFPGRVLEPGDLWIEPSRTIRGHMSLSVRRPARMPMELKIGTRTFPLFQFGGGGHAGTSKFGNFYMLWGNISPAR